MSKYDGLGHFLLKQRTEQVPMTFREIEKVTGTKLPNSKRYPAWWSNNTWNNVMTKVWLDAGFKTEQVDTKAEKLVFRRFVAERRELKENAKMFSREASDSVSIRHPIIGALKGTFSIAPGWRLEKPSLDAEEIQALEAGVDHTATLIDEGLSGKQN